MHVAQDNGLLGISALRTLTGERAAQSDRYPAVYNGISELVVKDFSRFEPNLIAVSVITKSGNYPITDASQSPVRVSFELNTEAFPRGGTPGRDQCSEVAFGLTPAKPACTFKPGVLNCK